MRERTTTRTAPSVRRSRIFVAWFMAGTFRTLRFIFRLLSFVQPWGIKAVCQPHAETADSAIYSHQPIFIRVWREERWSVFYWDVIRNGRGGRKTLVLHKSGLKPRNFKQIWFDDEVLFRLHLPWIHPFWGHSGQSSGEGGSHAELMTNYNHNWLWLIATLWSIRYKKKHFLTALVKPDNCCCDLQLCFQS